MLDVAVGRLLLRPSHQHAGLRRSGREGPFQSLEKSSVGRAANC